MRILIVEDERSIAGRVKRLVQEILPTEVGSIEIRDSLLAGRDYILHNEIDVLFLDLNLSGEDGFDMLKSLLAESFQTIIVSANKERALEAFEYGVVDFVAKPFDKERLEKALARLDQKRSELKKLVVKKQGELMAIPLDQILYFKGANIYTEIFIKGELKELSNKTLDQLEKILPPSFERIHKSYIVDMKNAKKIIIQPGSKYDLQLDDDLLLPIGRTKYKQIKSRYFT